MGRATAARLRSSMDDCESWKAVDAIVPVAGVTPPAHDESRNLSATPAPAGRALCLSACRRLYAVTRTDVERRAALKALRRADMYADFLVWMIHVLKKIRNVMVRRAGADDQAHT